MRSSSWRASSAMLIAAVATVSACKRSEHADIPVPINPSPRTRPVRPLPDQAFRVEWLAHDVPGVMQAGASSHVTVTFKNASTLPWPDPDSTSHEPPEHGAVRLAYRWRSSASRTPSAWGPRVDLERLLHPGETATLSLTVTAPAVAGDYQLQFDLLQEMATFFGDRGASPLTIPVRIG